MRSPSARAQHEQDAGFCSHSGGVDLDPVHLAEPQDVRTHLRAISCLARVTRVFTRAYPVRNSFAITSPSSNRACSGPKATTVRPAIFQIRPPDTSNISATDHCHSAA